jgi:hypothetical protein
MIGDVKSSCVMSRQNKREYITSRASKKRLGLYQIRKWDQ